MENKSPRNACLGFLFGFIVVIFAVGSLIFTNIEFHGMEIIESGILVIILVVGLLGGLLIAVVFYFFTGSKSYSTEGQKLGDWSEFLKAQPFICDKCGKFTYTDREYCEGCGGRYSLRKATRTDYKQYISRK
jgi:hypothetical protein